MLCHGSPGTLVGVVRPCLSGARCRLFAYGPADATAIPKPPSSLALFKSRLVLPFWYQLTQEAIKWVCVCLCVCVFVELIRYAEMHVNVYYLAVGKHQ